MSRYLNSHFRALGFAFVGGFIVTSLVGYFILYQGNHISILTQERDSKVLADTSTEQNNSFSSNQKNLGVLFIGYGGAGHEGGYLTDAIQVVYINIEKAKVLLISLPRDLWVVSPSGGEMKINNVLIANATNKPEVILSGAPALKKVISQITGLKMDYIIAVDFVGFQRAVGLNFDGLDVDVGEALDDPWYPIKGKELDLCSMSPDEIKYAHEKYSGFELERQFTCRYKQLHFEKGKVQMEGEQALEYVRSRHGSGEGDISRGKRQQEVLLALKKVLISLDNLNKIPDFFGEISKNISTDLDLTIIEHILPILRKAEDFDIVRQNLSPVNILVTAKSPQGAFILIPKAGNNNWNEVHSYIGTQLN